MAQTSIEDPEETRACSKCDKYHRLLITCKCESAYCDGICFALHLEARSGEPGKHERGSSKTSVAFWKKVLSRGRPSTEEIESDESTKWFGLVHNSQMLGPAELAITNRLKNLLEPSTAPSRLQYPGIVSMVGNTGSGKSTVIRALIHLALMDHPDFPAAEHVEIPIVGATEGISSSSSTTGEVSLYQDPATFHTSQPILYADCEGMGGKEPITAKHQHRWFLHAKKHWIQNSEGNAIYMDRRTASKHIYPPLLYLHSDIICFVGQNDRLWTSDATQLLTWSMVGAQGTINQHARPALVVILNSSRNEQREWVNDTGGVMTDWFFDSIEESLAKEQGVRSVRDLFYRSFSEVHVHYLPLSQRPGTTELFLRQFKQLSEHIRRLSQKVRREKNDSWLQMNTSELDYAVRIALSHFSKSRSTAFNFSVLRKAFSVPGGLQNNISRLLQHCLQKEVDSRKDLTASVLASSIVLNAYRNYEKLLAPSPNMLLDKRIIEIIQKALVIFKDSKRCSYRDSLLGQRCINIKSGHAKGHQYSNGELAKNGAFEEEKFDEQAFIQSVKNNVHSIMRDIKSSAQSEKGMSYLAEVAKIHRERLKDLRSTGAYPAWQIQDQTAHNDFEDQKHCFGCHFNSAEYILPCFHRICTHCLHDFQPLYQVRKPGISEFKDCFICGSNKANSHIWPFRVPTHSPFAGLRVLSLDGGGVRGIVELSILKRLEDHIDLDVPIGRLFDFIGGTSAGGMIAIGLGLQQRSVTECIRLFEKICEQGFIKKQPDALIEIMQLLFNKTMFKTKKFEEATKNAYETTPAEVFGRTHSTRVAITTTVAKSTKLITNYNIGDPRDASAGGEMKYMDSQMALWKAARCTSAAPSYFKPSYHLAYQCYDGGLLCNNPITECIKECKKLWGDDISFDMVLSIGSGHAPEQPGAPAETTIFKEKGEHWLRPLISTFLCTLNGEAEWNKWENLQEARVQNRSFRLNVDFTNYGETREPGLADVNKIDMMARAARDQKFHMKHEEPLYSENLIRYLADQMCASMFFFHLDRVREPDSSGNYHITGRICCKFLPEEQALERLVRKVEYFSVQGIKVEKPWQQRGEPFENYIGLLHKADSKEDIVIEVCFGYRRRMHISGSPLSFDKLHSL